MSNAQDLTQLLNRFGEGDRSVQEELADRIAEDLRGQAAAILRKSSDPILQPTVLVNEAWLKLAGRDQIRFDGRRAFFVLSSHIMRSVLVDHARAMAAQKRGGDRERQSLSLSTGSGSTDATDRAIDLLDFEEALSGLEVKDPELARIVELRVFGGLNHGEIVQELGVSPSTVDRRWRLAKAWLKLRLQESL